jgi:uncharacterized protein (DUF427 family)
MSGNSGPGYKKDPAHRVELTPGPANLIVTFAGRSIVETSDAITVQETGYPPVYYVPRSALREARLEKTSRTSHCPFKGEASYFTLRLGDEVATDAVWSYERPYDEVAPLAGYLAFYPDKVDSIAAT